MRRLWHRHDTNRQRTHLQPRMEAATKEYEAAVAVAAEWKEVAAEVASLRAHAARTAATQAPYMVLSEVGAGYRQHAAVAAGTGVAIDIGAGVLPELTLEEATVFLTAKVAGCDRAVAAARDALIKLRTDAIASHAFLAALTPSTRAVAGRPPSHDASPAEVAVITRWPALGSSSLN